MAPTGWQINPQSTFLCNFFYFVHTSSFNISTTRRRSNVASKGHLFPHPLHLESGLASVVCSGNVQASQCGSEKLEQLAIHAKKLPTNFGDPKEKKYCFFYGFGAQGLFNVIRSILGRRCPWSQFDCGSGWHLRVRCAVLKVFLTFLFVQVATIPEGAQKHVERSWSCCSPSEQLVKCYMWCHTGVLFFPSWPLGRIFAIEQVVKI